jgi:branched-chain amino acid transport system permease protein
LAIGAYTSTILWVQQGISPWIGMLVGLAIAGIAALVLGYAAFRTGLRGDYFTLVTVAFGMVLYELAIGLPEWTRGSQGMPISYSPGAWNFQFEDRRVYYYVAFLMWFGTLALSYTIRKSRVGLEMLAVRDDEAAAARGGVSVLKSKLISFTISAVIAAMAGTFWAQFILYVDPTSVAGIELSIQIVLVAVLGGMNSFLGGTLGAIILIPAQQYFASAFSAFPGADLALYGLILVLLMLFMPFGILGTLRKNPRWRKVIGW